MDKIFFSDYSVQFSVGLIFLFLAIIPAFKEKQLNILCYFIGGIFAPIILTFSVLGMSHYGLVDQDTFEPNLAFVLFFFLLITLIRVWVCKVNNLDFV